MNKFGEVETIANYQAFLDGYHGFLTEESAQKAEPQYNDSKATFMKELGLTDDTSIRFLISEFTENVAMNGFLQLGHLVKREHMCPIFFIECGYIEVPGCKHKVQLSSECCVSAIAWNIEDDEALAKWFEEMADVGN